MIIAFLLLCGPVLGEDFIVTEAEYVVISGNVSDTLGRTRLTPDSIRIVVTDSAGTELFDAWFEAADAQCVLNGDVITFFDQWEDINGAADIGVYSIMATISSDAQNNVDLFSNYNYTLRGVTVGVEQTFNEVGDILDTLQNQDNWVATQTQSTNIIDTVNGIMDTLQSQDGWVAQEATLAHFDTLRYIGEHGLGIFVDSTASNTNTVIGTDGTEKNPVSTLAAARTLSLALGAHRFYIHGGSTFNGASVDLGADYSEWEFYGEGFGIEIAFGGQLVTNSYFHNITLSGAMHASGGDVLFENCELGFITANYNGHAENCFLIDTLVAKSARDITFSHCQSGVSGNNTPTIDLTAGSSTLGMRDYSGGIRIINGASNDTISIEADGQVIIDASNTSLNITLRGNLTITDNGTTTNLTKDAVFSRQEAQYWVWANADTAQVDSSDVGVWLVNNLSGAAGGLDTLSTVFQNRLRAGIWDSLSDTAGAALIVVRDTVDALMDSTQLGLNMIAISGDATAADNFETMLDGTGGKVLDLAGLHIRATSAEDTAFIAIGADAGHGMYLEGGSGGTAHGFFASGGSTAGSGMWVLAQAGNNSGFRVAGFGSGQGAAFIGGATGHGFHVLGQGGGNGFFAQSNSSGPAMALASASGKDLIGVLDTFNFTSDFFDSAQGAAAGITVDQIWEYDTANISGAQAVGSMLKDTSAYQGSASGLTAAEVADTLDARPVDVNVKQISGDAGAADNFETMLDGTGGGTFDLAQLAIRATSAEDTALIAIGADNGWGAYFGGAGTAAGLALQGGPTGQGMFAQGGATSGDGILSRGHSSGAGHGMKLQASGANKDLSATIDLDDLSGTLDASEVPRLLYFDTLIYQGGVWVDAGANTNTVVGVDGTPKNPVGTIAAAKTIADALGFATIFFLDGANETIAATMEHYRFTGITRNATVNLGGQDVDGSCFEHLMLTGQQGGTGSISVINAGLSSLDSLQIHARNCAILGPISLRGGNKTNHFDKCYSSVAGSGSPILNFNDATDSIYVNWRAYSGGLELQNMTTNHIMSYESDGQLIINVNCDNGVISARGMMTITDNGTTMSITKDAVFSRSEADLWVWANADTTQVDSSDVGVWLVNNLSGAAGGLDTLSDAYRDAMLTLFADTFQNRGFGVGSQTYTFTHLALDTSGSDVPVEDVKSFLTNIATSITSGPQYSLSDGTFSWGVDSGSYDLFLKKAGYVFARDTFLITTDSTDTTRGYDWAVTSTPTGANTCIVYGNIHTFQSLSAKYATITITFPHEQYNTCDSSITHPWSVPVGATKAGYFEVELTKSTCLAAKKYKIVVEYKGKKMAAYEFTVPDQDTFELFF
jgi:hypothetical protein